MALEKENTGTGDRILLIFSQYACVRKRLSVVPESRSRLILPAEDTGLQTEAVIVLKQSGGCWRLGEKELSEKSPFYYYTEKNERLLLLLSPKAERLAPAGRIALKPGDRLRIGSDFKNQIFYECFSLVDKVQAEIFCEDDGYVLSNPGFEGICVNGKAFDGSGSVGCGDCVDIYGLHILVLKEMLVCVSFCGVCRIAGGRNIPKNVISPRAGHVQVQKEERWIERRCEQEEELHAGEVEVALPDKPASEQRQPLFLSLGPGLTMVLPILLMAQFGSRFMEGAGSGFYYMSVVMSGSSAALAFFWGLVNHGYRKRMKKQEGRERERQYREYLGGIEKYLDLCREDNRRILEQKYPPLRSFLGGEKDSPAVLWNRYYRQKDFLFLRLGEGEMPFQVKVKLSGAQNPVVQGKLAGEAKELAEKFLVLDRAPAGVDLYENRLIGIVGNQMREALFQLLLQIMACHCYTEVKTVCFYREGRTLDREAAECLKWMPHSWSPDRKVRFLAGNEREAAEILPLLTKELERKREAQSSGIRIPWYIVIVLDEELIFGEPLYGYLTDPEGNYPVSAVFIGKEREALPKSCRFFIKKTEEGAEILNLGAEQVVRQEIIPEICESHEALRYVRRTAGFRVRETEGEGQLPGQVGFLQLYGCGRVEELEIEGRWRLARTEERLKVPLGCRTGGNIVSLDVHERFHGPHGLIAGTTGSGKSELLQTYLLSMAISFSPSDVNFFMIDYKGGGTGNMLMGLPHCAGVISNLSGKQIKRAMSAITSENKRRQILLSSFQVNHIDAYTRLYREGKAAVPMPHLILVVDEFAELKKEEPEFMQEIISLAQVGRSLGVHLILATQKPAGTVDDKIWSNARFRLCLRVQDRQDSMDMLHNGDAALLTLPGQCYLQIGNHEYYELFQAGYCGGTYAEEGQRRIRAALVQNTGRRLESPGNAAEAGGRSQIEVLVDYVNRKAEENGYDRAQALWLPELPEKILIRELGDAGSGGENEEMKIILGLCDDPENQRQFTLYYQPPEQGHLAVCGGPATGKTTLLKTVLWQLAAGFTCQEALFMVADIGQESLGCFLAMPGCLAVLKEKEDKDIFFHHLERLMSERKKTLAGISAAQYNRSGQGRLPQVFLIVDNFGSLVKILDEGQEELLMKLAAQGLTLGIYLILSAAGTGEISGKLYEKIKTTLALEMSDRFQYGDILRQYYLPVLPKENQKGRGLCRVQERVLEFQTALALEEQEDYAYIRRVEETGRKKEEAIHKEKGKPPVKFPVIPKAAAYKALAARYDWEGGGLPLGYCLSTGNICGVTVGKAACFLISGVERTGRSTLVSCLIESALHQRSRVAVLDMGRRLSRFQGRRELVYLVNEEEIENWRSAFQDIQDKSEEAEGRTACVFISDMGAFCSFLYRSGQTREERIRFWEEAAMGKTGIDFMAGIYHPGRDYEAAGTGFFREFTAWQQGIHLGGNAAAQRALSFDDLSYGKQNQYEPVGIGYLREGPDGKTRRLLLPGYEEEGGDTG